MSKNKKWSSFKGQQKLTENFRKWTEQEIVEKTSPHEQRLDEVIAEEIEAAMEQFSLDEEEGAFTRLKKAFTGPDYEALYDAGEKEDEETREKEQKAYRDTYVKRCHYLQDNLVSLIDFGTGVKGYKAKQIRRATKHFEQSCPEGYEMFIAKLEQEPEKEREFTDKRREPYDYARGDRPMSMDPTKERWESKKWSSFKEQQKLTENFRKWAEEESPPELLNEILDPVSQAFLAVLSVSTAYTAVVGAIMAETHWDYARFGDTPVERILQKTHSAKEKTKNVFNNFKNALRDKKIEKQRNSLIKILEEDPNYNMGMKTIGSASEEMIKKLQKELSSARSAPEGDRSKIQQLTGELSAMMKKRDMAIADVKKIVEQVKASNPDFKIYFDNVSNAYHKIATSEEELN